MAQTFWRAAPASGSQHHVALASAICVSDHELDLLVDLHHQAATSASTTLDTELELADLTLPEADEITSNAAPPHHKRPRADGCPNNVFDDLTEQLHTLAETRGTATQRRIVYTDREKYLFYTLFKRARTHGLSGTHAKDFINQNDEAGCYTRVCYATVDVFAKNNGWPKLASCRQQVCQSL
jgi:hypothetical protein